MTSAIQFIKRYWAILLIIFLAVGLLPSGNMELFAKDDPSRGYNTQESAYDAEYLSFDTVDSEFRMAATASEFEVSASSPGDFVDTDQKIIKTGSLSLHVDDVRDAVQLVKERLFTLEGSTLDANVSRGEGAYSAYMTVRVPSDQFENAILSFKEVAIYVDSEYSNAQDVTDTYIDLEARLVNLQAEEAQYQSILERTGTISEVLEVTQALSNVRYQIESTQNSLDYYDTRIAYSTINLSLSEDESISSVTENWRPFSTIKNAFKDWVAFLEGIVDSAIYVFVFIWPLLIIFVFAWKKYRKSHSKK